MTTFKFNPYIYENGMELTINIDFKVDENGLMKVHYFIVTDGIKSLFYHTGVIEKKTLSEIIKDIIEEN